MPDPIMSPRTPVEKAPDVNILREMICCAAERLMEPAVGAATGEKSPSAWRSALATLIETGSALSNKMGGEVDRTVMLQ